MFVEVDCAAYNAAEKVVNEVDTLCDRFRVETDKDQFVLICKNLRMGKQKLEAALNIAAGDAITQRYDPEPLRRSRQRWREALERVWEVSGYGALKQRADQGILALEHKLFEHLTLPQRIGLVWDALDSARDIKKNVKRFEEFLEALVEEVKELDRQIRAKTETENDLRQRPSANQEEWLELCREIDENRASLDYLQRAREQLAQISRGLEGSPLAYLYKDLQECVAKMRWLYAVPANQGPTLPNVAQLTLS